MVTRYTNRAVRRWLPLTRISEMDGRPVRARTADLYRVNERSDGTSSTYEYSSEHSVAARAVRNAYCSHVVPTRAGWQTALLRIRLRMEASPKDERAIEQSQHKADALICVGSPPSVPH
jgi:hypothetical protein